MIDYGFGVTLRAVNSTDTKLVEWRNEFEVRRWCRQVGLLSDRDHQKWLDAQNDTPTIRMFVIAIEGYGDVGVCGLTGIDLLNRRAEFSLYINTKDRRRGCARAALLSLLAFGFNDLNLNRIWGETFEGNPALNLFDTIGFEREGVRKEFYYRAGHYIDCTLVSIGRDQFMGAYTPTEAKEDHLPA